MTLPFATTAITILRRPLSDTDDPYDPADYPSPEWETVTEGVRAVIAAPTANANLIAGDRVTYSSALRADPCDLQQNDIVIDQGDGTEWAVLWARPIVAIGLDHTEAQLRMVTGFAQ